MQTRNTPEGQGPFQGTDRLVKGEISTSPYHQATILTQRKKRRTQDRATDCM